MDRERKKRIQTIRLLVTEVIMVIAVFAIVTVLLFFAMGYKVDRNGEFSQSGLIQLNSFPSGAVVEIDDEILPIRTELNRLISSGNHSVRLTKVGYDSWEKEVSIESGILLKITYPRLFFWDREAEKIREYTSDISFFSANKNRDKVLYGIDSNTEWILLDLLGGDVEETKIDVSQIMEQRQLISVKWNNNSDKVLLETSKNGEKEWIVLYLKKLEKSVNISQSFGMNFSQVDFMNDNGERIIAVENGNLRTMTISEKTISNILANNIAVFYYNDNQTVYLTNGKDLIVFQDGAEDSVLASFSPETNIQFVLGTYLGKRYLMAAEGNNVTIYKGDFLAEGAKLSDLESVASVDLANAPATLEIHANGEFYVAKNGKDFMVFDAELTKVSRFSVESDYSYFLDDYLVGTIVDEKLVVRDFDGTNMREITNATSNAFISKDNKYLYYLKKDRGNTNLFREKIVE